MRTIKTTEKATKSGTFWSEAKPSCISPNWEHEWIYDGPESDLAGGINHFFRCAIGCGCQKRESSPVQGEGRTAYRLALSKLP
jgi:hypothetical protein